MYSTDTQREGCEFFFFCFKFVVLCHQEGRYWVFGLFLLRPINASVTERGIVGMLEKQQQQKELHWSSIFYYKRY